jgi:hypothetical protein
MEANYDINYVKKVCKLGQEADCCRYLVMGGGFECVKLSSLKFTIDQRVANNQFIAKGDNCIGQKGLIQDIKNV